MRFRIAKEDVPIDEATQESIDRHRRKFERLCSDFDPNAVELVIRTEEQSKRGRVRASGELELPGKTLHAEYSGHVLYPAAAEMLRRLERELKRYKAERREQELGKPRKTFQAAFERTGATDAVKEQVLRFLEENLTRFYNYAYREVRSRVYQGFVRPGDIGVRDVLDEAVLELLDSVEDRFDDQEATQLLYRAISRVVVRESNERRLPQSHLEELLENEDIDTELHEYYQPDEVEWMEEVVPDIRATAPDQAFELSELERRVEQLVSQLPQQWRESFVLTTKEGLSPEEAAMVQRRTVSEVEHNVEMARAFLRERLAEIGVTGVEES